MSAFATSSNQVNTLKTGWILFSFQMNHSTFSGLRSYHLIIKDEKKKKRRWPNSNMIRLGGSNKHNHHFLSQSDARFSARPQLCMSSYTCFGFKLQIPWLTGACSSSSAARVSCNTAQPSSFILTPNLPFAIKKDPAKKFSTVYKSLGSLTATFEKVSLSRNIFIISTSFTEFAAISLFIRLWRIRVLFVN